MAYAEKRGKSYRGRYKLPNGRYGSVVEDERGQPFTTARAAKQYAEGLEADVRRKTFINPRDGKITVGEWAELWLKAIDVGPLSEREYRSRIGKWLVPEWGKVAVGDLSATGVAIWEKQLRAKVAKNTADGIMSVFRTMLDDAARERIRVDNPVATQRSKRRGRFKPKPKNDKVIATPRQALLVARNGLEFRGFNEYVLVLTLAYTGLRIGELAGLHCDQMALDDGGMGARIHAAKQSQYINGVFTEVEPKYDSGRGLIIPPFLAELLRELMAKRSSEWVFGAPRGGRLIRGGDWYTDTWHPMVDGCESRPMQRGTKGRPGLRAVLGVEGMVPHGLRHSHKAWLDEDGHPRVAVEERLGHRLQGVEGTYSHTTLPMELKIAETLQRRWKESQGPSADDEYAPLPGLIPTQRS